MDRPSESIEMRSPDVDVVTRNECRAEGFVKRTLEASDWVERGRWPRFYHHLLEA